MSRITGEETIQRQYTRATLSVLRLELNEDSKLMQSSPIFSDRLLQIATPQKKKNAYRRLVHLLQEAFSKAWRSETMGLQQALTESVLK